MAMEKSCSLLVHFDKGTPAMASEIKEALEGDDVEAKIEALKKAKTTMATAEAAAPSTPVAKKTKTTKAKTAAPQKKAAPFHPSFGEMITEAIVSLKERTSSSQVAIAKFIEEKHSKPLPPTFKKLLLNRLKKLVAARKFVKVKNSYKLPAAKTAAPAADVAAAAAAAPKKKTKPAAKPKATTAAATTKPKPKTAAKPKAKPAAAKSTPLNAKKVPVKKPKSVKKSLARKKAIMLLLNGETIPQLFITTIRYVLPSEDHTIQKLPPWPPPLMGEGRSTLELRQFNGSIYYTDFEEESYLSVSARINFGADSEAPVRYPDDVFDRLWQSDSLKKANYLVDVAAGTEKVSTIMPIEASRDEMPPQTIMRTDVVGTNGSLTYRLNLDGFPGSGWAVTYFSEIEDLAENETRRFRLMLPGNNDISKIIVNIEENSQETYRLYEPGFTNLSFPFVLSFRFRATADSS